MENPGKIRKKIRQMGMLLAALFVVSAPLASDAAEVVTGGVVSNNIHNGEYTQRKQVAQSYLCDNRNGTFSRIENMGDIIMVEFYDASFHVMGYTFLKMEMPKFGGCWFGDTYNYVLFGQDNMDRNKDCECFRLVQYDKNWQRLGQVSISNCNTMVPFDGCNTDMTEYGNELYIRTGHRTYLGQQAVMTIAVRQSDRKLLQVQGNVSGMVQGAYENVAATFIDASDKCIVAADHSLNYPRGINATRYGVDAGTGNFISNVKMATGMALSGDFNTFSPYTSLGGFEVSGQYDILVGRTTPHDQNSGSKNVFVARVPKNSFQTADVQVSYLTGYSYGDVFTVSVPYIVKVSGEQYVVLWEVKRGAQELERVDYVYLDGSGQMTSEVKTISACLSDCQPILFHGQIVWYTTNGAKVSMYSVPAVSDTSYASQEVATARVSGGVDYSQVYNFAYYVNRYPDVRVLYQNNPEGALQHFIQCGMPEGRQGSENFNPQVYRNKNADLRNAFGENWTAYYMHFINTGAAEGRKARL
ncbi:MAG: hypothetical protein IJ600_11455 [Lachnospiraceae bacterium]|nr:hypothetical protein [Lachnospiraceae bacterium]